MSKTTKELNVEIAKLRATARITEKAEFEEFGRWVVDQLVVGVKGAVSERIEVAREHVSREFVAHRNSIPAGHNSPDSSDDAIAASEPDGSEFFASGGQE